MIRISVIMSVYNGGAYLKESIESVLAQTYDLFEFLIIDDCSVDNTIETIRQFQARDKRIKLLRNEGNIGLTKSLNKLIKLSQGEYIARMDADDIAMPDRFEKQISILDGHPNIDLVFSGADVIGQYGEFICRKWMPKRLGTILRKMPLHSYITHSSVMLRRNIFDEVGTYNEKYRVGQDWELWKRLIGKKKSFYMLNDSLVSYRVHSTNVSNFGAGLKSTDANFIKSSICISNGDKLRAFRYARSLKGKVFFGLLLRLIIPYSLNRFRSLLIRRYSRHSPLVFLKNQEVE